MISRTPQLTPLLLGVLGFAGAVGPFATDMYLASFGSIQQELGTSSSMVQMTMSVFFIGTAVGQLLIGPLSDSLGRRRLLLVSLSIYALASIALVFTPTIEVFIALRLVLGLSGSAGIVLARAIAVDLDKGETAVRALSLIAMVGALGPLLAPPIGGIAHALWNWRGVLAVLAVIAVLMLALVWAFVPESLPPAQRQKGRFGRAFVPFGSLMGSRRFLGYTLAFSFSFGAMMSYIAASPFVGQSVLGMSPLVYSFAFALSATAMIIVSSLNAKIAPRVGPSRMLTIGLLVLMCGAIAMLVFVLTGTLTIAGFIISAFVLTAGTGMVLANASALALAQTDHARGLGAALIGAGQFIFGGIVSPLVGAWGEHTAVPMGVIVFVCASGAVLSALLARSAKR